MADVTHIESRLRELSDRQRAEALQRFFKTGPGEYGEGDVFLGIRVPKLRELAKEYESIGIHGAVTLLRSPVHEQRLLSLLILVRIYSKGDQAVKERVYDIYLEHSEFVNNWDLVDTTAPHIVGRHLLDRDKGPLYVLARSPSLWERRIAVVSTLWFIRKGHHSETFRIGEILLLDKEDLIHKAVGWMLREVGKRDGRALEGFLKAHYGNLPRTTLRYAIERFPEPRRRRFLKGDF
jgi:3-methyladenine DNA glycosylase AlkD